MEKLEKYKEILESLILQYAEYKPRNTSNEWLPVCDNERGEYLLIKTGWDKNGETKTSHTIFHFRLNNNKVYVEEDNTDADIVGQMLDAGIPKEDIVLAFYSPQKRKVTDFAQV